MHRLTFTRQFFCQHQKLLIGCIAAHICKMCANEKHKSLFYMNL